MPLLYYWRSDNYYRDLDRGAAYHLNQANPLLHAIDPGDSLWAFTRNRQNQYVLAAELVVRGKTFNPPNYKYGPYRLWGDLTRSRYFAVDPQPSAEPVLRGLSVRANAPVLGNSFQGHAAVRLLTTDDHRILVHAAAGIALEPRACILPEEALERAVGEANPETLAHLVERGSAGLGVARREYLIRQVPVRSRQLTQELQGLYAGRCQICLWDPRSQYGQPLCEGHHVQWLSRGGDDALPNMMLVCPNHHAAIHQVDAPFDWREMAFDFGGLREALAVNCHL